MSIASAIQSKQQQIEAAYSACSSKGATLPAVHNCANLANCIDTITGGGSTEIPSYVVESGVVKKNSFTLTGDEFLDITEIDDYGWYQAYSACREIFGALNLSNVTRVGNYGMYGAFFQGYGLTSVDLSKVVEIEDSGMYQSFSYSNRISSVDVSSLEIVGSRGLSNAFNGDTALASMDFKKLKTLDTLALSGAFMSNRNLADVYFRALTTSSFGTYTNQFQNLMTGTGNTIVHTLHFPSNLESTIQGLSGYPLFGGTSGYVVCAFDLPATS